jgi:hypothetical protein
MLKESYQTAIKYTGPGRGTVVRGDKCNFGKISTFHHLMEAAEMGLAHT